MTSVRPLAPSHCPNCGAAGSLYIDADTVRCPLCGHVEGRSAAPESAPVPASERKLQASYGISHKGEIDPWARAAFDTGQDCISREDWRGAIDAFRRAIDAQPDFVDAHLWLARVLDDPVEKRDHITTVLAHDPNHLEALRELMVLDGKLTPEEAERSRRNDEPQVVRADLPVGTRTVVVQCPVCGGDLTANDSLGRVECKSCGYVEQRAPQHAVAEDSLTMALLRRKAEALRWLIGERLLHCNNCGAERTVVAAKLSARCPFCGSNHVIQQDALGSFQQPDGLLPFSIPREQAGEAIKARLDSWGERIKGWFDDNRVARGTLEGVYLPFWVFDAIIDVTRTTIDRRVSQGRASQAQPYLSVAIPEMFNDVPVCAVTSPPPFLTARLGPYHLDAILPYEPDLLAKHPAALYDIDVDRASLDARSIVGKAMREKHGQGGSQDVQVNVFSGVKQMSFQLVLLPVWVATLVERDGDTRIALVNGQTGEVVLGRTQKSGKTRE